MNSILEEINTKVKLAFLAYSLGLILSEGKRTCTKIASYLGLNHDFLYRFLSKTDLLIPIFPKLMLSMANHFAQKGTGYLIIDDTCISKIFSRCLEGVYNVYNTALKRPERGLCIVVVAWSNGKITVPLGFEWLFHKDLVGENYLPKSEIAKRLILGCYKQIPFDYLLADGHYATKPLIKFLSKLKIKFVFKIARNRKVTTKNNIEKPLTEHLKLKLLRNSRSKSMRAKFDGVWLYFSVHKRKNKNGDYTSIYLVSNIYRKSAHDYLAMYEKRWNIEKMFRTMKQYLGISQCSSRKIEVQKAHIYAVFFSYGFLQNEILDLSLNTPEEASRFDKQLKFNIAMKRIQSFSENFEHVA